MAKNPSKPGNGVENKSSEPAQDHVLIKKYPNRRLYNTSTSAYIVLNDIIEMVRDNTPFVIEDTKSGEDITRSILNQIIFEQETKPSNFHFSLDVQKQLISMYGDAYGKMMPDYLTESMNLFSAERNKMQETVESIADKNTQAMMNYTRGLARQNMEMFRRSMNLLGSAYGAGASGSEQAPENREQRENELEEIQRQIDALQDRLKTLK